jgi:argonaute-like protein implicated in RNA metabolism and viral defense
MHHVHTGKHQVRSVKCCVVYDSKDGTIRHVHRIVTVEGADETPEHHVVERTLELATDLGIDRATVRTLRVDDNALQPGVRYAVDIAKASLIAIGKSNQKDLLGR